MDFVLNEKIGEDMMKYCPEYEEMLRPLVASLCDVLKRYKFDSKSDTIMTGRILDNNEFEVMLSEGLGDIIDPYTKNQVIFESAKTIADLLMKVMHRGTMENR